MSLLKLPLLLMSAVIIYIKPLYTFFFFVIFFVEYFYFIYYLALIYFYFDNSYHKIFIQFKDVSSLSPLVIWINVCKLQAFRRVYVLLLKKKFNLRSILFTLLIVFLGVPYKFCKLIYSLYMSKHCFRDWLEIEYTDNYNDVKNSKIELLNNKIYINCHTPQRLISEIKRYSPHMTSQQCFNIITDITKSVKNFKQHDADSDKIKMVLGKIKNDEYFITNNHNPLYHYTYWKAGNSIHQTSNTSFLLVKNQKIDLPLPSITKIDSMRPGTIITRNIQFLEKRKWLWVPSYQIAAIKSNNLDSFDLAADEYEVISKRRDIIKSLFDTHLGVKLPNDASVLQQLHIGCYTANLEVLSHKEIIDIIDNTL